MNADTHSRSIGTEARIRVRHLFAEVEADAAAVEGAFRRIPRDLLCGEKWKGKTGTARAIARLLARAPRPPDYRDGKTVAWRWLRVLPAVPGDEQGPPQQCIAVGCMVVGHRMAYRPPGTPMGVVYTAHSLGRMFERAGVADINGRAVCIRVHDLLLALTRDEGNQIYGLPEIVLPVGDIGFFIARPRYVGREMSPIAVCRTFLNVDAADARRNADAEKFRTLLEKALGR